MIDWDAVVLGPVHGVFDEPVVFMPKIGAQYAGTGIFDKAYREVDLAGGMAVTTEVPMLGIRTSQCPVPLKQGDQVLIRTTVYMIREPQFDGKGYAKLLLNDPT
jgi:hypothetical protein